ncbi:MAG: hypothetical protein JSV89_13925 [Spirochaetaceae bacterium]|nr:MAG: hypothetical protein JSV89_13925 [Spirochaetaceae bacterium]
MSADDLGFSPRDVFREYCWNGPWRTVDCPYLNWQRVTDPQTSHEGARKYLPNPVNTIQIDDLQRAVRAECCIEQWGGHAGTSDKRIRINGHEWIEVPESSLMGPERPESYQYMRYPTVAIPLEQLREGDNEFELTCSNQISHLIHDIGWGQWGIYAVIFRIYYDADKLHPSGRVAPPVWKDDRCLSIALEPGQSETSDWIDRIDFLGFCEDFDHNGDGRYREWHYRYRYGRLMNHLGTVTGIPYEASIDTTWIPDQAEPMQVMVRITDYAGMSWVTPVIEIEWGEREEKCLMYTPRDVPACWQSRDGNRHSCTIYISDDLSQATEARMILTTWNGYEADEICINGEKLLSRVGRNHDFALSEVDVPLAMLRKGENTVSTYGTTPHHGIEVLWPGPVIKVRYGI